MQKPVIAIFMAGAIPTEKENALIEKYIHYPCVYLNAETYEKQDSLMVDCAIGAVPEHLKGLKDPDTAIKEYENFIKGVGAEVGGTPPQPPVEEVSEQPTTTQPVQGGFGLPPQPPKNK